MKDEELREIDSALDGERIILFRRFVAEYIALQGEVQRLTEELAIQTKAAEIGAKNLVIAADEVQRLTERLSECESCLHHYP